MAGRTGASFQSSDIDRDLGGVRVLEVGTFIDAAFAGKLLADLGAEVVKVEDPERPDLCREFGPFPGDVPDDEASGLFLFLNCNKQGVTLNLATATGRELFGKLVARSDVLIEGLGKRTAQSLGLDYDSLRRHNPGLIMVSLSSFGGSGPYSSFKGSDLLGWHGSGTGHRYMGEPGRPPIQGAWYQASHWGGILGAGAAVLGLIARERIGAGQHVDISEAEALAQLFLAVEVSPFFQDGTAKSRGTPSGMPGVMECKDGWVSIQATAPHMWEGLLRVMGNPDWGRDASFGGTLTSRQEHRLEIRERMRPWLESKTKEELFRTCQANSTPCAPLYAIDDLCRSEHLRARGYFVDVPHPTLGHIRVPGAPYLMGEGRWSMRRPAPSLGQHNEEVYRGLLGLPKRDLADLRRAGII